jgi:hypothetical protein
MQAHIIQILQTYTVQVLYILHLILLQLFNFPT